MERPYVLAVDDDPHSLSALRRVLRECELTVETVSDPLEALRTTLRRAPDLIVLDISMPTMSGYAFLRCLRRLERRRAAARAGDELLPAPMETPVIFLTARVAPVQRARGITAGAVDYVTKPWDAGELRARVQSQLRRTGRHRQMAAAARLELLHAHSQVDRMARSALACRQRVAELGTFLEFAEYVRRPASRNDVLERARDQIHMALGTLAQITEAGEQHACGGPAEPESTRRRARMA